MFQANLDKLVLPWKLVEIDKFDIHVKIRINSSTIAGWSP